MRTGHRHLIFVPHPRTGYRDTTRRHQQRWLLVAKYPDSTKTSLTQRLTARARARWPDLASIAVRHHGTFSYVDGVLADGTTLRLCRLRYIRSAHNWRFAIYRASHEDYEESFFPTGLPAGTCEDALDVACGLYLADPTAWT